MGRLWGQTPPIEVHPCLCTASSCFPSRAAQPRGLTLDLQTFYWETLSSLFSSQHPRYPRNALGLIFLSFQTCLRDRARTGL